jgi:hypothetical protein
MSMGIGAALVVDDALVAVCLPGAPEPGADFADTLAGRQGADWNVSAAVGTRAERLAVSAHSTDRGG